MSDINLGTALGLPPEQAVKYFENKGYRISLDWRQVWQEEHDRAFTVAGVVRDDILHDIRSSLDRALKEGWSRDKWAREITPTLKRKGWWGSEVRVDDNGEARVHRKGSASRLDLIFRQNVLTAYAAGRWQRQQEAKRERPFLKYSAILDGRTRPAHRALDGKIFPVDDPFWDVFYPPNGFRCRCMVVSLSRREVDPAQVESGVGRMVELERDVGQGVLTQVGGYRLDDTPGGRVVHVDPGFSRNPGKGWDAFDPAGALPDVPPGVGGKGGRSTAILPGQPTFADYGLPAARELAREALRPSPARLPAAKTREAAVAQLATALQLEGDKSRRVETPIGPVVLQRALVAHMAQKELATRERYAAFVLPTLEDPDEVWLTAYADGYRRRYIAFFQEDNMLVVVRVNRDGTLFWNGIKMRDKEIDKNRTGVLLHRRETPGGKATRH